MSPLCARLGMARMTMTVEKAETPHMNTIRSIVVGSDFSEAAGRAVETAADLALAHGASLTLVHGVDPVLATLEVSSPAIIDDVRKGLEHAAQPLRLRGVNVTTQMRMGKAWWAISEAAKDVSADLVVVASHGRSGLTKLALGSVADRVLRSCEQPVLLLPVLREGAMAGRAPSDWSCAVVGIDLSDESIAAAGMAAKVLRSTSSTPATLVLFHTVALAIDIGGMDASAMPERWAKAEANAKIELEALAATWRTNSLHVEPICYRGYASDGLLEEAKKRNADFIAMGTHGRGAINRFLLGSVAERVAHQALCPVLTVRHRKPADAAMAGNAASIDSITSSA